jgi:TonB family protein
MNSGLPLLIVFLCGIVGAGQSVGAANDASDQEVADVDFGRPCTNPQPAFDPRNAADRLTRKSPHSDPATPLTQPPYPKAAQVMGMEGIVIVSLLINEQGQVSRARVQQGARYPILNAAGVEGTRDWKLQPGTAQGKPVCMWGTFAVMFKLEDYDDDELAKVSVSPQAERLATLFLAGQGYEEMMSQEVELTAQEHAVFKASNQAFLASGEWSKTQHRVAGILSTEFTPAELAELLKFQESPLAAKLRTLKGKLTPAIEIEANTSLLALACTTAQVSVAMKGEDASKLFAGEKVSAAHARRVSEYAGLATTYCFCQARWQSDAARGLSAASAPECGKAPELALSH